MRPRDPFEKRPDSEEGQSFFGLDDSPGAELHLADYLEKLRRHWKLVALLVVLCVGAAAVLYVITPKQYSATARIQIERKSLSPISSTQNPWFDNWLNMEYYPTQYKLLESRGLAERVVIDLGLADDERFNPAGRALAVGRSAEPDAGPRAGSIEAFDDAVLGRLAQRLRSGLQVEPVRNTQLVDITYRSSSPEFAARAANGFAEAFIDWGITSRRTTVGRASSFLESQIEALKEEIQEKEARLRAFSRETDIISLEGESSVVAQQLQSFNRDYIEAKAERIEAEARYKELLEAPRDEVADRYSDGSISNLIAEQRKLEREYQTKLQTYKPEWPAMVELRARIEQGRDNLQEVIDEQVEKARQTAYAEYQTALRRERSLEQELEQQRDELLDQSSAAAELTNLQVEIAASRDLMDQLLQQPSETEVAARLQSTDESNVRIVDRALVPGAAFRPSLKENLAMGFGVGLLLGVGAVFLIEYMDRTIKTPEEVERRLMLPNLAVIPDIGAPGSQRRHGYGYGYGQGKKRKKNLPIPGKVRSSHAGGDGLETIELVPKDHPRLSVSEAYRSLRTALLLSSAEELEVVAVTSPGSGEGKTATSTNLAVVMAQLGRRVLLIDGDLRKPRIHEVFGVSNRTGLVNVLAGGEDPSQVLRQTEVSHLSVIPSGPVPPNPSELLASDRMRELLERARSRFDFVVIDTPPVLAVTDSTVIGAAADGVVLCLSAGKVLREDAKSCRDRLLMADVKILGTVLNRHRDRLGSGKTYYYYYSNYAADEQPGSAA